MVLLTKNYKEKDPLNQTEFEVVLDLYYQHIAPSGSYKCTAQQIAQVLDFRLG